MLLLCDLLALWPESLFAAGISFRGTPLARQTGIVVIELALTVSEILKRNLTLTRWKRHF